MDGLERRSFGRYVNPSTSDEMRLSIIPRATAHPFPHSPADRAPFSSASSSMALQLSNRHCRVIALESNKRVSGVIPRPLCVRRLATSPLRSGWLLIHFPKLSRSQSCREFRFVPIEWWTSGSCVGCPVLGCRLWRSCKFGGHVS